MKCNKCGCEIENDAKFCTECGNVITNEAVNLITCTKCGNPLKPDASFCTKCGQAIKSCAPAGKCCPSCNAPLEEDSVFCTNCGAPVSEPKKPAANTFVPNNAQNSEINQQFAPVTSSSNSKIIPIVSIIVGIALIAGAGIFAYKKFNDSKEDKKPAVTETQKKDNKEKKVAKKEKKKEEKEKINEIDSEVIKEIIDSNTSYTDFGIYVLNLKNDYEYGYKENSQFLSSALGQIVIIDTVSKVTKDNDLSVDDEYVYFEYLPNGKEAPSSKNEDGLTLSVRKCIEDVAVYGDNNKSNLLVDYIADVENEYSGFNVINDTLRENGYKRTQINRKIFIDQSRIDTSVTPNATTPKEIANIFCDLIKDSNIGNPSYMKNIFRCVGTDKKPIGMKKYIPDTYSSCNVNALTGQTTNDVAYITDDETEIIVAFLSTTEESKVSIEGSKQREAVQEKVLEYILSTQFAEEE